MENEIKYRIRCGYVDEIYAQKLKDTIFFIQNEKDDFFIDYNDAKKTFDKLVNKNEELIQENKMNTFFFIELIKETRYSSKTLESRRYD